MKVITYNGERIELHGRYVRIGYWRNVGHIGLTLEQLQSLTGHRKLVEFHDNDGSNPRYSYEVV